MVAEDEFETFLRLLEYTPLDQVETPYWVNNGKLSELACAAHLSRLECAPEWLPLYEIQAARIKVIAEGLGLVPLLSGSGPAMSLPFLAPHAIDADALRNNKLVLGKYYKPLAAAETCAHIYSRIINIPSHPGVSQLSREDLERTLTEVLEAH